jgi:LmbE family N-acetylglucosaminyl deacetylase
VEGVIFNGNNKGAMALQTKNGLQKGIILLPPMPSDQKEAAAIEKIEEDLRSIVRCVSAAGNVRFTADRRDYTHADHYSALTLAVYKALGAGEELRQPKASGTRQKQRANDYSGYN